MESPLVPSPILPWEIIERIIGHSSHNPKSIRNFSHTCRELRPRSLCLLVANVTLYSRNKIFDFCHFLQAKPHLTPFVRSLTVHPHDFAPVPLLRILPNLSKIEFNNSGILNRSIGRRNKVVQILNQPTLTCCRLLSTRIQTLRLSGLVFGTYLQFLHLLSAFTSILHLECLNVSIFEEGDPVLLDVAKQRLSRRLRLLSVSLPASVEMVAMITKVYISSSLY
ncbi:hypothetical protein V8D89_003072 [Ganoderma adspersum]